MKKMQSFLFRNRYLLWGVVVVSTMTACTGDVVGSTLGFMTGFLIIKVADKLPV